VTRYLVFILPLLSFFTSGVARAEDDSAALKQRLEQRLSDLKITELRPSPVAGLYELVFGTRVALVTADGRYLLNGQLIDLETRRNLTLERRSALVKRALDNVGDSKMIVFATKSAKRTVTVFTDVDCFYCQKFHREVPELNRGGVKVRYLLYPRAGKDSESYRRSVAVWCSKDRNKAIGIAKQGGKLDMRTCANPVEEHLALGADVGVEGTPALVLDDGRVVPGYVPHQELLTMLGLKNEDKAANTR
jgi:thiol:disulfide interchange protein DsbC